MLTQLSDIVKISNVLNILYHYYLKILLLILISDIM